jgi:hypothetical protein
MTLTMSTSERVTGPIIGYKSFNLNWTAHGRFQYEVGKTYELPEGQSPELCVTGFHFCRIPTNCDEFYRDVLNSRHALIHAWDVIDETNLHEIGKSVCRKIKIVSEIPSDEWEKMSGIFSDPIRTVHLLNGQLHREDGPAVELSDGSKCWYRNGQLHRDCGPAIEYPDGYKAWCQNGQYHRSSEADGPAIEHIDGTKYWYRNGQLHREDGPAIEYSDGGQVLVSK